VIKIICDRPGCGNECRNYHAVLNLHEVMTTGQGEEVDTAYMPKQKHLCRSCRESLTDWYGGDLGLLGEEAMAQLKSQRMAEREEDRMCSPEPRSLVEPVRDGYPVSVW
jgi:hypothetical protein